MDTLEARIVALEAQMQTHTTKLQELYEATAAVLEDVTAVIGEALQNVFLVIDAIVIALEAHEHVDGKVKLPDSLTSEQD